MLSQTYRLPLRREREFFHVAKRWNGKGSVLLWAFRTPKLPSRGAVIVPLYLGSAVERNRAKRIVREELAGLLPQQEGVDIAVRPRTLQEEILREDLQRFFQDKPWVNR